MNAPRETGRWRVILGTLALALGLTQLPWGGAWLAWRPDFLLIALLFWVLYKPDRVGFGMAFVLGLIADFQDGVVFGQHASAYVIAVYIVLFLRLRLMRFDPLRQAAQLLPVLLLVQTVVLLIGWLAVRPPTSLALMLPALSGALLWFLVALWHRVWHGKAIQGAE